MGGVCGVAIEVEWPTAWRRGDKPPPQESSVALAQGSRGGGGRQQSIARSAASSPHRTHGTKHVTFGDGGALSPHRPKDDAHHGQRRHEATPSPQALSYAEPDHFKFLLLGSGESGKSTVFKRFVLKYGEGYEDAQREAFVDSIHENTIESMITLVRESQESEDDLWQISEAFLDSAQFMIDLDDDDDLHLNKAVATHIQKLWVDDGIQETFEHRSEFQIPDGTAYFLEDIHRLARPRYQPTDNDILRCRDRTIGIVSEAFHLPEEQNAEVEIVDLGGQRSERKNWKHAFEEVTAILFVIAISEFDMKLFEDFETNRMEESLEVFQIMSGNKRLKNVPFILLFNKMDLFHEKLNSGVLFEYGGYKGPQDAEHIKEFVRKMFEKRSKSARPLTCLFVSAIDESFSAEDVMMTAIEADA